MTTATEFAVFEALDLAPIKLKLMHVESGEGWSEARADAAAAEYRRFLFLMKKYPEDLASPTVETDIFWHYHILDTMKYARDCEALFGYFLHHYPYVGMGDGDSEDERTQAGERMRELYEAEFGVVVRGDAAFCASPAQRLDAFCASPSKQASAFCASPAEQDIAFCASPGKQASAFCASPSKQAAAFCASPAKQATAFCASPAKQASAFCASPAKQVTAFCASPAKQATAFCASPSQQASAFCASPAKQASAFCASPGKAVSAA